MDIKLKSKAKGIICKHNIFRKLKIFLFVWILSGRWLTSISIVFPTAVPDAPTKPKVTKVDSHCISIEWSQPASDGGSPITSYVIEEKTSRTNSWTKVYEGIKKTACTISDLTEGQEYQFHVAAINKAGQGSFSEPSQSTTCKPPYSKFENF